MFLLLLYRYEAGDHVAVYPINDPELVTKLGSLLGADLDTVVSLNNVDGKYDVGIKFGIFNSLLLIFIDITHQF